MTHNDRGYLVLPPSTYAVHRADGRVSIAPPPASRMSSRRVARGVYFTCFQAGTVTTARCIVVLW